MDNIHVDHMQRGRVVDWRASIFSTGSDSPVSVPCVMNKSFAAMRRTLAGIMSPAESFTTSPGNQLLERDFLFLSGTHHRCGHVDHCLQLLRRRIRACFLHKRSSTPRITIRAITLPARKSPVADEIAASTMSRITSGLRVAVSNRHGHPRCLFVATTFAKRLAASPSFNPSGEVFIREKTSLISNCATSARTGEKWMDLSAGFADAVAEVSFGRWFMNSEGRSPGPNSDSMNPH
jgi:hypothetical protein